jgi:hypothetical protein
MQLYDDDGQRKHLTPGQQDAFLKGAKDAPDRGKGVILWHWCRTTAWTAFAKS